MLGIVLSSERQTVITRDYFLPALLAAQYAFNLADNFALVARLNVFFLALAAGLPERAPGLARRRLVHLAFCAAPIFRLVEALMLRLFVGTAPDLAGMLRRLPSSLLSFSM